MKLSNNRQKSNNPLFFFDKEKGYTVNPIYMIDEQINTNTKFAINKNTDKGISFFSKLLTTAKISSVV